MEPFPQLTPTAQPSNANILLKISQLSNEYIVFRTSLNLSQAELMNLNRLKLALSDLQRLIYGMSFLSKGEARVINQKKILGILNGLEGFFQRENQGLNDLPQIAQQYTMVLKLYSELKDMLCSANLLAPQPTVILHDGNKGFIETVAPAQKYC